MLTRSVHRYRWLIGFALALGGAALAVVAAAIVVGTGLLAGSSSDVRANTGHGAVKTATAAAAPTMSRAAKRASDENQAGKKLSNRKQAVDKPAGKSVRSEAKGLPTAKALPNFTRKGANLIRLLAGAFDPQSDPLPAPTGIALVDEAKLAPRTPQYWLVQVRDQRFPDVVRAVRTAGGAIAGTIPDDTYMVRATPKQRLEIGRAPAVRWTGYYQPAWRIPVAAGGKKSLLELVGSQTYRVHLFRDDPKRKAVGAALARLPGVEIVEDAGAVVDVRATAAQLPAIAALPAVEWVELKPDFKLLNANARWVTDTGVRDLFAATAPSRLTGAGVTAAVADTAINYTTDLNGRAHVGFRDCSGGTCKVADYTQTTPGTAPAAMNGTVANNTGHRKMAAFFDLGNTGPNPFDDSAHGSHVAGSVTGDKGANGAPDGHDGMAPGARHVHQNIGTSGGGLVLPGDLYDLFRQAYRPRNPAGVLETSTATGNVADYANYVATEDARTHNNSWSSTLVAVPNAALSVVVDRFVWDHEDMVIVFSAGNGGPNTKTFSAPSNAKNDISSGASANGRQPMSSIDSMAIFSSHGPTEDGRFGPDIATPGQIVVSAKGGTNDGYHVLQGTSMSGPVLTGLATLVRQYFWSGYAASGGDGFAAGSPELSRRHNPSAALVKATLINGAVRMRGWYTGTHGPDRSHDGQWPSAGQGYGLANLDNSLYFANDPGRTWYHDVWRADSEAFTVAGGPLQERTYTIDVQGGEPLDVTLAWTDAPDLLPAGSPALRNNLNLTVTGPGGVMYVGNNMNSRLTGGVAVAETTPGPALPDAVEVTERVRIASPAAGAYTIKVSAPAITIGNQGFALAASGRIAPVGETFSPGPARQVDASGSPTISNLRVDPVTSNTAVLSFTTNEPTTAHAVIGGQTYVDSYNVGNDAPNIGPRPGLRGLNEGQVETSDDYANKPVLGTSHEILLSGFTPGQTSIAVFANDLAGNEVVQSAPRPHAAGVFGADAPDIGQLLAGSAGGWKTGTQLYAGTSGTTTALGAFMFRVPETFDPSTITGASVEMTSAHHLAVPYRHDPLLYVDLLNNGVEAGWGTQTYEQIRAAAADARVYPETTHKRGGGYTYAFTFACRDLQALKNTLTPAVGGQRLAAFRWDSTAPGLFSMDFGFNRRSNGPDKRPRLVLFTPGNPNPYGRACDPATPAPAITDVGIHFGSQSNSTTVSWETDVRSDSMVLFRRKTESTWTQVGTPALTQVHHVQVHGLDDTQDYVFVVRSAACNGAATTDTNGGQGYTFIKPTQLGPGTVRATYDFETGEEGWSESTVELTPDDTPDTEWRHEPPGHDSNTGWNTEGTYFDLDEALLVSPPVSFAGGGSTAAVEFFVRHDLEVPPALFSTNDALHVEYSADGGTTWNSLAVYKGRSANYPAFQFKQLTFPAPAANTLVRFKHVTDDNVSWPLFEGVAVDKVSFVSYSPSGGPPPGHAMPLAGPAPPPSAGLTGLAAPAVRPGPASTADVAAGTGLCSIPAPAAPDLVVSDMKATQNTGVGGKNKQPREGEKVIVSATITNVGTGPAPATTTEFVLDGTTVLGSRATSALEPGQSTTVEVSLDTRGMKGEHTVQATADKGEVADEVNEGNNVGRLTFTINGNKVQNPSFEQSNADGTSPAGWSGSSTEAGTASWSDGGSDGNKSVSLTGTGGTTLVGGAPTWTSDPIAVTAGETLDFVVSVRTNGVSSAPSAGLAFLGAAGQVLDTVKLITAPLTTAGFETLEQSVTIPAGVARVQVVLTAFAPTDAATAGTVTFDDVGLFAR